MNWFSKVLRYANALSIDIAIGAVCCSRLLYYILEVQEQWYFDLVLGLTVWLIYTVDHLFDAYIIKDTAESFRHRLHQKYFKSISFLAISVFVSNALVTLYFFPLKIILAGAILMLFVGAHQILNLNYKDSSFLLGKEMRIAMGYSMGLALVPFFLVDSISPEAFIALFIIFQLALINLLFFSTIEKEADSKDRLNSLSIKWPLKRINQLIITSFIICLISCLAFILSTKSTFIGFLFLCMLLILLFSFRKSKSLIHEDRYRNLGDGIFLIPFILFWL